MGEKSKKKQGVKSNSPDNEGITDELFIYFSDYYYALKNEFYHRLSEKRQIVLAIMSFCLVAEMTFMGAVVGPNPSAVSLAGKCLFAVSLALWFISFICALTQTNKIGRFFCALTEEEGMPCVTTRSDVDAFVASGGLRRKDSRRNSLTMQTGSGSMPTQAIQRSFFFGSPCSAYMPRNAIMT